MISLKISGIIIICLLGVYFFRLIKPEYTLLPIISALVICVALLLNNGVAQTVDSVRMLTEDSGIWIYVKILFKALGITYLTAITTVICKSAGEEVLADISQTAGKLEILALCLPLAKEIVSIAKDLL